MNYKVQNIKLISQDISLACNSLLTFSNQKHDCKEIINTNPETREFITGKVSYSKLKPQVVRQTTLDAVKHSLGTEVRTRSDMTLKSIEGIEGVRINDQVSDRSKRYLKLG